MLSERPTISVVCSSDRFAALSTGYRNGKQETGEHLLSERPTISGVCSSDRFAVLPIGCSGASRVDRFHIPFIRV